MLDPWSRKLITDGTRQHIHEIKFYQLFIYVLLQLGILYTSESALNKASTYLDYFTMSAPKNPEKRLARGHFRILKI